MADLDPQVKIRIIELANKWVDDSRSLSHIDMSLYVEKKAEKFEQAYKAILKTVEEK